MTAPIDELRTIMAKLRDPDGCPWDREQDHQSIRAQLIEECYELVEAIDHLDDEMMKEELGDVLLHVIFHCQLAKERGAFTFDDVARGINEKLVRRHPHVFGDQKLATSAEVLVKWDELKKAEKPERKSPLSGVPQEMPALMRAQEMQKKAGKVGFDWGEVAPVLAKIREEIDELEADITDPSRAEEEIGDVFFALVNLARQLKIDAEQSCRLSTEKFIRRFHHIEKRVADSGREWKDFTLGELDAFWDEAKAEESTTSRK